MTETPVLKRYPDWASRLARYLAMVARAPFAPGTLDCAIFAAGAIEAQTGVDLAEGWRGRYTTLEDGLDALTAAGFEDHLALARAHLEEIAPAAAEPGDIAACLLGRNLPSFGVVQGEHIYVLVEDLGGLALVPRSTACLAWRVPG